MLLIVPPHCPPHNTDTRLWKNPPSNFFQLERSILVLLSCVCECVRCTINEGKGRLKSLTLCDGLGEGVMG